MESKAALEVKGYQESSEPSDGCIIGSLVFPPIVVTSLAIMSAIMSGLSFKMKFSAESKKISKLL